MHQTGLRLPRQPAELNERRLDVVGISPDKPEKLAKFRDAEGLTFPLLSDPDRKVLTAYGAYGEKQLYGKTVTGVIRSTFLVDDKGTIAVAQYNVKDDALPLLAPFRYVLLPLMPSATEGGGVPALAGVAPPRPA